MRGHVFRVCLLAALTVAPLSSHAGLRDLIDSIRSYDLNDYAFGVALSASQNPYVTAANSTIAYPYLTSFEHPAFTKDWLLLTDGELGARKVTRSGWEFGGLGRIETLGLGRKVTDELLFLNDRQWTVEVAPLIGYRRWPVHFRYKLFKEISGRHGGLTSEFSMTLPREAHWGYLVPGVSLKRYDDTYTGYYYQVAPGEVVPGRPEYRPGAAVDPELFVTWGYRISDKWLLSGKIAYELLDDEIANSPIVGRHSLWSGNVGIAYNADIFQPREYAADTHRMPHWELRAGLFQDNVKSRYRPPGAGGSPLPPIEIEDLLAVSSREAVLQLDAIWRITPFHRIEAGYFDLQRNADATLTAPLDVRGTALPAGADIAVRSDLRMLRLAYSYSLISDAQKELGFIAGVHVSRLFAEIDSATTGPLILTSASTPLPTVGVHGAVSLGPSTYLGAQINLFRLGFDNYAGSLNHFDLVLQHVLGRNLSIGVGYTVYQVELDSEQGDINGAIQINHFGPRLFLGVHF